MASNLRDLVESGESGKLPLKFVGFAKFARPPSELNSTANSENLPLRRSSKITLGSMGLGITFILESFKIILTYRLTEPESILIFVMYKLLKDESFMAAQKK